MDLFVQGDEVARVGQEEVLNQRREAGGDIAGADACQNGLFYDE